MSSNSIFNRIKVKLQSSLLFKFIISMMSALVVMSAAMLLMQSIILNNDISEIQVLKVERVGKLVSAASQNAILSYDFEMLERFSSEIRKDIDVVDVIFLDQSGVRLNSEMHKDSLTSSEAKFGRESVQNSEQIEMEFPIQSDGSTIGTLVIKTHSLETQSRINGVLLGVSAVFVVGVILLVILMWVTTKKTVVKPIKNIEGFATELATGNVEIDLVKDRSDEIGSLQSAFAIMINSIKKQSVAVEQMAAGNLEINVPVRSENDVLSKSLVKVIESLKSLVAQVTHLSESAVNGDLKVRGDSSKYEGGYKNIIEGVNSTLDAVILPIEEGAKALSKMAQNDFTVKVEGEYKGDHKLIVDSINNVSESLNKTLYEVSEAIQATASASTQISSSSE
ncbi:MAG: HAMP domain-containing protein, partial [Melioribacteraceae bacterium]|nr:HAMP domain-containing protein [Melioribacteraceae bacterium]